MLFQSLLSKYSYQKKYLRCLMALIDGIGYVSFFRKKRVLSSFEKVLVMRLDHIGDIVLSEPFLAELKRQKPNSRLMVLTTPLGKEILGQHSLIDEMVSIEASWFSNHSSWFRKITDWIELIRVLRGMDCDVIVDLRGDVRHILASRIAKPKAWLVSYGGTGGGFLLDYEASYPTVGHAAQKNMNFLKYLHLELKEETPALSSVICSNPLSPEIREAIPFKNKKWVALHVGVGAPAKAWPGAYWRELIEKIRGVRCISNDCHFFWIGDKEASKKVKEICLGISDDCFTNLTERLPISELGTFFRMCDLLISVDSGPVHIAAAHGLKTVVLFSGTSLSHEWKPLYEQSLVLSHAVSCSPCHQRICPMPRHECMEGIKPLEVYKNISEILS